MKRGSVASASRGPSRWRASFVCGCWLVACSSEPTNGVGSEETASATSQSTAGESNGGSAPTLSATTPAVSGGNSGASFGGAGFGSVGSGGAGSGGSSSAGAGGSAGFGGAGSGGSVVPEPAEAEPFVIASPVIESVPECSTTNTASCGLFPAEHTSYMGNMNVSPELGWGGVPAGTKSFALTLRDITFGQPHWALWNVPGDVTMLPADISKTSMTPETPAGSSQANATFADGDGYYGPQADCNVYEFKLYALAVETFTPSEPQYVALVESELDGLGEAILGQATLRARNDAMMSCE